MTAPDVIVIGSGPGGACAAQACVDRGLTVEMLDVGHDDSTYRSIVPDEPFSVIRRTDPEQRRYFLGDDLEGVPRGEVKVGAQLTPPRQFITKDADARLPYASRDFLPMQSLALGGLGAGWGAQAIAFTDDELRRTGIEPEALRPYYQRAVDVVGVSAAPEEDIAGDMLAGIERAQPPLDLDTGAMRLLEAYRRARSRLHEAGFHLGRTPLAILSEDLGDRRANPYFDMDFWSDSRRSVFRPRYLVEALARGPRFRLTTERLVTRFRSADDGGVIVTARNLVTGEEEERTARRALLAAGAINSARLALRSARSTEPVPLLCNPYTYVPALQWRMLGRAAADRRHSLSQLSAVFDPDRSPDTALTLHFYSYRSLLLFKLVKEFPLPLWAGLQVARLLVNALAIIGIHHPDAGDGRKTLRLASEADPDGRLELEYEHPPERLRIQEAMERRALRIIGRLGCRPLRRIDPGKASSIHYAGTLPFSGEGSAGWTSADGRLERFPGVFVADSAPWRFLPSKSLTLTIMANAMRVADAVADDLAR